MVVFSKWSLSFKNLNGDSFLVISISGENLRLFSWNVRSLWNNFAHNTSDSFNTQWERSGIDNDDITSTFLSTNNTSLNGSTIADSFIRVNTSVWLFTIEPFFNELSNLWNSGWTSYQNDFINFILLQISSFHGQFKWFQSLLEKISVKFFEFSSGKSLREIITFN